MKTHERHELEISALIDGELPQERLLPVLDHLTACSACRAFYRRARRLDDAASHLEEPPRLEPAPAEVWRRIQVSSGLGEGGEAAPRHRAHGWLPRIAAAVLLAFGLWSLASHPGTVGGDDTLELVLEEDRGRMSEERFVELTAEVLRSDRRFHLKMLEVMATVAEISSEESGADELCAPRTEARPQTVSLGDFERQQL